MIPWFQFLSFPIGPLTIQVWGLCVATGILVGAYVAARLAKQRGIDPSVVWDAAVVIIIAAMIGGRLGYVLFYDPSTFLHDPVRILKIWEGGMSMFGGFLGAIIAGIWFMRRRKLNLWQFSDTLVYGLPIGIGIGRIGCFLIHDHPGTLTHFLLGVKYPDGVRHDLGFYESIFGFLLAGAFFLIQRKGVKQGTYLVVFLIAYGLFRFFADFLRVADTRYFFLTPAQYLSAIMIAVGIWFSLRLRRK